MGLRKSRVGCGHYKVNENFFVNWSPEMAYITGVIAADGNIYLNQFHNKHDLEITSKDFAWLEKIKKTMKAGHSLYARKYVAKNGDHSVVYRFRIGSTKLVKDLLKIGIHPKKSLTLEFPHVPSQYLNHFVRGYFDGDGNAYPYLKQGKYQCIQLSFYGTRDFLASLNHRIAENICCKIKNVNQEENICELRYNTREAENVLRWMYYDATICLSRKYRIFVDYISKRYTKLPTQKLDEHAF